MTPQNVGLISVLPTCLTLDMSRTSVILENLDEGSLTDEVSELLKCSVQRRDNLAVDELKTREDIFTHGTAAFALRDPNNRVLRALLIIQPCQYSRSIVPRLAQFHVITCEQFSRESVWRDLARLAQLFADQLDVGYVACVTCVFYACVERLRALAEEGFNMTVCIPTAGRLAGSSSYIPSYVMFKRFQNKSTHPVSINTTDYATYRRNTI